LFNHGLCIILVYLLWENQINLAHRKIELVRTDIKQKREHIQFYSFDIVAQGNLMHMLTKQLQVTLLSVHVILFRVPKTSLI